MLQWSSPGELIGTYVRSEGGLAPPQVYELSRLLNFQDADKLHRFSVERTSHRVTRWFPVPVFCSDGYIVAYPGKSMINLSRYTCSYILCYDIIFLVLIAVYTNYFYDTSVILSNSIITFREPDGCNWHRLLIAL